MNRELKLDVHTHTIMSGHAYSTMQEMVTAAQEKHLDILGITEHAPGIPGTCHPIYFRNLHVVPRQYGNLRLMLGAELNLLDTRGTLDLDEFYYRLLDLRIAGIHLLCWQGGTREENTDGMVAAIRNPWTQIISHPGDGTAELLFEPIVLAAKETGTLLEINNSSLNP
jgi:putative hydrolase